MSTWGPIIAYNRTSDERGTMYSNIYKSDYVIAVDEILLDVVNATPRLKKKVPS